MKYALYARKSSEDTAKQISSVPDQVKSLKKIASLENIEISNIYTDEKSAKDPHKRSGFKKLIEDIESGKVNAILCWKLNRLFRNPLEGGLIQQYLIDGKIKKIITAERTYYQDDNTLITSVEIGIANQYSRDLRTDTVRGQTLKAETGVFPGKPPIGYLNDTKSLTNEKIIIVDKLRSKLVRKCFDLVLQGMTVPQVHKKATSLGLKSPPTKSFAERNITLNGMYSFLKNIFYTGDFMWRDDSGNKKVYPGTHKPLISKNEFKKVQKIISSRNRIKKSKHQDKYSYRGLFICGECGATITIAPKPKRQNPSELRTYYRCTHRKAGVNCKQKSINEKDLEKQVESLVNSVSINSAFVEWTKKWVNKEIETSSQAEDVIVENQKKILDSLEKQKSNLVNMRIQDHIDEECFLRKKKELEREQEAIEEEMIESNIPYKEKLEKTIEVLEMCSNIKSLYKYGSIDDKNLVLTTLGSHRVLKDKKLDIVLKPQYEHIQSKASEEWIQSDRFPTLPIQLEKGIDEEEYELIKNGGGGEVLPPASINVQK